MSTLLSPPPHAAIPIAPVKHVSKTTSKQIACMVLVAFVLRLLVIFVFHTYTQLTRVSPGVSGPHFPFGFETGSIAGSLAQGEGFSSPFGIHTGPTAWIAPVYPLMCAVVFKMFGLYSTASAIIILSLNSLFAALTCLPIYMLARVIFGSRVAALAGWSWATFPFFMRWPTTWMWEISLSGLLLSFLVFFSLAAVEDETWGSWVKLGGLWGVAAITNPSLLSVLPFSLFWIAIQRRRASRPYAQPILAAAGLTILITVPWLARNWIVMGKPVFIRDNFGFEFYLGNYHGSNGLGYLGKHPTENEIQLKLYSELGELGYVKHFQTEAVAFVKHYPEEFAILTLKRFVSFWDGGMINYEDTRYWRWEPWEMLCLAVPMFFGLLVSVARDRNRGAALLGLVVLLYPLPYYFTYPQERYRHAVEPEMVVLTCFLMCALWDHARARFDLGKRTISGTGETL